MGDLGQQQVKSFRVIYETFDEASLALERGAVLGSSSRAQGVFWFPYTVTVRTSSTEVVKVGASSSPDIMTLTVAQLKDVNEAIGRITILDPPGVVFTPAFRSSGGDPTNSSRSLFLDSNPLIDVTTGRAISEDGKRPRMRPCWDFFHPGKRALWTNPKPCPWYLLFDQAQVPINTPITCYIDGMSLPDELMTQLIQSNPSASLPQPPYLNLEDQDMKALKLHQLLSLAKKNQAGDISSCSPLFLKYCLDPNIHFHLRA